MIVHRRALVSALVACAAFFTAGCSVLDTSPLYQEPGEACRVSTGAYYLPRGMLTVMVTTKNDGNPYEIELSNTKSVADVRHLYCLDYLRSPFADDYVGIDRTPNGLLQRVYTKSVDKTDEIAIKLINAAGLAAASSAARSRAAHFRDGITRIVAEFTFDPFDYETTMAVNDSLEDLGFCVYMDTHDDPYAPSWSSERCNVTSSLGSSWTPAVQPVSYTGSEPVSLKDVTYRDRPVVAEARQGILYRPNITHSVVILRREDPGSGEPWEIYKKTRVELPNAAPIFSVQVERSAFVERITDLDFTDGVLVDVSIKKDSELAAFFDIPLVAAQVIVKIPTQILQIRLNTAQNEKAIMEANTKLLATIKTIEAENAANAGRVAQGGVNKDPRLAMNSGPRAAGQSSVDATYVTTRINYECAQFAGDHADPVAVKAKCVEKTQACRETSDFDIEQCLEEGRRVLSNE